MRDSLGGGEHERAGKSDSVSASETSDRQIALQPLCDCRSSSSAFVVYTCPKCMNVALRAMKELINAGW